MSKPSVLNVISQNDIKVEMLKVDYLMSNEYVCSYRSNDIDLDDWIKIKVQNYIYNSTFHTMLHTNVNGPKNPWAPKFL